MSEVSQKQLEANRQNAKLGGVKTEEGKTVSKYNALKHGILSKEILLEGENEEALTQLGKRLRASIKPVGEVEMLLADRLVSNFWRLRRLLEAEKVIMEWEREDAERWRQEFGRSEEDTDQRITKEMLTNSNIEKILRYETTIERSIYKAFHELQRVQSAREGGNPPAPLAVDIDVSKE